MSKKTIVVGWDFSKYAKAALKFAVENFDPENIRVVCVLERPDHYAFGVDWQPTAEATAHQNCVSDFRAEVSSISQSELQFDTLFGDPAAQILQFAKDNEAEQIVMSTHGRTGLKRLMMGSVTQKVLTHANCPVVVLPSSMVVQTQDDFEEQIANAH